MTIKFYTFGPDNKHPDTGESLGGRYVAVSMPDSAPSDACRARMFRYFGNQWASEYKELPKLLPVSVAVWPHEQFDRAKLGPEVCAWMDANDPDMAPANP